MQNKVIVVLTVLLTLSVTALIYLYINKSTESLTDHKNQTATTPNLTTSSKPKTIGIIADNQENKSKTSDTQKTLLKPSSDDLGLDKEQLRETSEIAKELENQDLLAENNKIIETFNAQEGISEWGNRVESQINSKLNEPEIYNHLAGKKLLYVNTTCKQTVCKMTFTSNIPRTEDLDSQLSISSTKTAHIVETLAKNGLLTELSNELNTDIDNNNNQVNVFMTQKSY